MRYCCAALKEFLLTPLREGRRELGDVTLGHTYISTHAPAGGATVERSLMAAPELFLLTPLREGRLDHVRQLILAEVISTHAPAGGATTGRSPGCRKESISTHAPAEGATDTRIAAGFDKLQISTHAPAGGATNWGLMAKPRWKISTHAPAGGATRADKLPYTPDYHFYSRPCGRGDDHGRRYIAMDTKFLLTPLREGRRGHRYKASRSCVHFYSRPCGRGDLVSFVRLPCRVSFLLTPLREGRPHAMLDGEIVDNISTHAPAGGATQKE